VKNFTGDQYNLQGASSAWRINGTQFSAQTDIRTAANTKIDDGIYIYVPSGATYIYNWDKMEVGNSLPFCQDGNHDLYCDTPASLAVGTSVTASSYVTCRSGDVPANISWTNAPAWSAPTAGSYTGVSVTADCGSTPTGAGLSATCGNITVAAPTAVNIGQGDANGATLNTGTLYQATFTTGNGGAFRCPSTSAQNQVVGTYNGQPLYIIEGGNKILSLDNSSRLNPANGTVALIAPSVNLGKCYKDW
jgi:hypothetical protein